MLDDHVLFRQILWHSVADLRDYFKLHSVFGKSWDPKGSTSCIQPFLFFIAPAPRSIKLQLLHLPSGYHASQHFPETICSEWVLNELEVFNISNVIVLAKWYSLRDFAKVLLACVC